MSPKRKIVKTLLLVLSAGLLYNAFIVSTKFTSEDAKALASSEEACFNYVGEIEEAIKLAKSKNRNWVIYKIFINEYCIVGQLEKKGYKIEKYKPFGLNEPLTEFDYMISW